MADRPVDEAGNKLGWRAHLLKDAVVEMMHLLWGDADSKRDEILSQYDWDESPQLTDVKIQSGGKLDIENAGIDLKIVVDAGDTKFQSTAMKDDLRKIDDEGNEIRAYLGVTPIQVKVVANGKDFSHMAAAETAIALRDNAPRIKDDYAFHQMKVQGYSAPKSINEESGGEPYVSAVSVEIMVAHKSMLPRS